MKKTQTSITARRQRKAKIWLLPSSGKNETAQSPSLKRNANYSHFQHHQWDMKIIHLG